MRVTATPSAASRSKIVGCGCHCSGVGPSSQVNSLKTVPPGIENVVAEEPVGAGMQTGAEGRHRRGRRRREAAGHRDRVRGLRAQEWSVLTAATLEKGVSESVDGTTTARRVGGRSRVWPARVHPPSRQPREGRRRASSPWGRRSAGSTPAQGRGQGAREGERRRQCDLAVGVGRDPKSDVIGGDGAVEAVVGVTSGIRTTTREEVNTLDGPTRG